MSLNDRCSEAAHYFRALDSTHGNRGVVTVNIKIGTLLEMLEDGADGRITSLCYEIAREHAPTGSGMSWTCWLASSDDPLKAAVDNWNPGAEFPEHEHVDCSGLRLVRGLALPCSCPCHWTVGAETQIADVVEEEGAA